jgi:hypothetical protein
MSKKSPVVYWSPAFRQNDGTDRNMLYFDPVSLFDQIRPLKTEGPKSSNFLYCPAFSNFARNTFVLKNPITSTYDFLNDVTIKGREINHLNSGAGRLPTIKDRKMIEYGMNWIFFSEDDLEITLTSPYFENPPHLEYGSVVPGRFNISKWFRNVNVEYCLHPNVNTFSVQKNETLAYISFNSDEPVKLVRFEMTEKLRSYANSGGSSSQWNPWIPMIERYRQFKATHMHKLILKEIKNNLVDTETEI